MEEIERKIKYIDRSELYIDESQKWKLRSGDDWTDLKASIERNGILEPLIVAKDGKILSGRNRYLITEEIRKTNPDRFKLLYCWQFQKELPPEKETEIVNHLKTLAPRVKDSDIDRLLAEDFADLLKQKHTGGAPGKERFNRSKYIAERIGRSEGYIRIKIAAFQKKQKLKRLKSGEIPLNLPNRDQLKSIIRKYRKVQAEYQKLGTELNDLKDQVKSLTDLPVSFLIDLQNKGEL